jgi:signal transduction histidine kinase
MPRAWVWIQLIIGWLPLWALFTVMMMSAHRSPFAEVAPIALRMIALAALLSIAVHRLTALLPWPYPFRLSFIALHLIAAGFYTVSWFLLNSGVESLFHGRWVIVMGPGIGPYLIMGVWLYVMITGVAYASRAAERGARLSALEARTQLAALRAQLHPHFLFNALHTVVQLIPLDPRGAVKAAELLSDALRIAIEEHRDLVPLADEWRFVQLYLQIEEIRFGDRLRVHVAVDPVLHTCTLPSFALQTLVENAVRHAAAPRVETTDIHIAATLQHDVLIVTVADNGAGADIERIEQGAGTGLRRLRERLSWLYGNGARLEVTTAPGEGFSARLILPQQSSIQTVAARQSALDDE